MTRCLYGINILTGVPASAGVYSTTREIRRVEKPAPKAGAKAAAQPAIKVGGAIAAAVPGGGGGGGAAGVAGAGKFIAA